MAADRIELLALEDGLELHATWLPRPLHEIHVGIEEPPAAFAARLGVYIAASARRMSSSSSSPFSRTATPTLTPSRTVWTMTR